MIYIYLHYCKYKRSEKKENDSYKSPYLCSLPLKNDGLLVSGWRKRIWCENECLASSPKTFFFSIFFMHTDVFLCSRLWYGSEVNVTLSFCSMQVCWKAKSLKQLQIFFFPLLPYERSGIFHYLCHLFIFCFSTLP